MTDKKIEQETLSVEQTEKQTTQEVIEVEYKELEEILFLRVNLKNLEANLANFLVQCEKKKISMLDNLAELENLTFQKAKELQEIKNIDSSLTYELKLPEQKGEKGYFIRKDS